MFWKVRLPLLLSFVAGVLPIIGFFASEHFAFLRDPETGISSTLEKWMVIVSAFALPLGVVNVLQNNVRKVERRDTGWPFAVVLLTGLIVMGGAGILGFFGTFTEKPLFGLFQGITDLPDGRRTPFAWMADYFYIPLQSTMFSLLAFYIASAAFRAFRARNVEATILLVAAVIVMLGRIPPGEAVFAPFGGQTWLPRFTEWLMSVPNGAAQRGIIIGAALGAASLSLRVILGIERSYLGLEKSE